MSEMTLENSQIDNLSKQIFEMKNKNSILKEQIKDNNKKISDAENQIMEMMEEMGLEKISTEFGSHTFKTDIYPAFDSDNGGFEKFMKWAVKTESFEFIRKQVNTKPFQEFLIEYGKCPIGLTQFTKAKLNSRIKPDFKNTLIK